MDCDENGTYVSDEKKQGIHWTLLAIDLKIILHIIVIHLVGPFQITKQAQLNQTLKEWRKTLE